MTEATIVAGIDPGISGAIAFAFSSHHDRISTYDMPVVDHRVSAAELAEIIKTMRPDIAVIEAVHSRPGEGVSSAFKFGDCFGVARGVISALGVPCHFVSPQKWKRYYGLDSDKEAARRMTLDFYPLCSPQFKRKKDHGRAEAALLARYGIERILPKDIA